MENKAFLPLFLKLDSMLQEKEVLLAIDGGSAGGKTTLGKLLEQRYACNVFHMDDFFLRPMQRTKERLAEPGGNVDRERIMKRNTPEMAERFFTEWILLEREYFEKLHVKERCDMVISVLPERI